MPEPPTGEQGHRSARRCPPPGHRLSHRPSRPRRRPACRSGPRCRWKSRERVADYVRKHVVVLAVITKRPGVEVDELIPVRECEMVTVDDRLELEADDR